MINVNEKYIDYIQAVGKTKSDKGIDITFESAIADRNVLNLSFIVKNNNSNIEKHNVQSALVIPAVLKVNGRGISSSGGGANYEIIDENTVRVLTYVNWDQDKLDDYLNIDIEIPEMFWTKGNWDVSFALNTKEIEANTYVEKLDKVITLDNIDYNLRDVVITPLTTMINYDFTNNIEGKSVIASDRLGLIVFDGEGNEVMWDGHGLSGGGNEYTGDWYYINSANAEKLDIIPWYSKKSWEEEEKLPPTKVNIEEFSPINIKINEDVSMEIYNCTIDGEYAIFEYSYRYLDWITNGMRFADIYVNIDGKSQSRFESDMPDDEIGELYKKFDTLTNKSLKKIVKIGNSKDIEVGAYDGTSKEILKDEAFTIAKK